MRLIQYLSDNGQRAVAADIGAGYKRVRDCASTYALAGCAMIAGSLEKAVAQYGLAEPVDAAKLLQENRILVPLDHQDPAHCHITGTGLTHLGSANARDAMHKKLDADDEASLSDSMKMFRMGLEGGKPASGQQGVQPEWFYKGDGAFLMAAGQALASPDFALDGGEEPEIAGLYIIGPDGQPFRLGFALANEFSDHITERQNYLYLAHSKLRPASVGPEALTGPLPADIRGASKIIRGGQIIWEKPFLSGEANMSHTIANLEYHHFKYTPFRRPGDVHIHMFGTATLSFADGVKTQAGDIFEISAPDFGLPLANPLSQSARETITVKTL